MRNRALPPTAAARKVRAPGRLRRSAARAAARAALRAELALGGVDGLAEGAGHIKEKCKMGGGECKTSAKPSPPIETLRGVSPHPLTGEGKKTEEQKRQERLSRQHHFGGPGLCTGRGAEEVEAGGKTGGVPGYTS